MKRGIVEMACVCLVLLDLAACGEGSHKINERKTASDGAAPTPARQGDLSKASVDASGIDSLDPDRQRLYILDLVNAQRQQENLALFLPDAKLDDFAQAANDDMAAGGAPHAYIKKQTTQQLLDWGICHHGAENQAPNWPFTGFSATIGGIMDAMYDAKGAPSHYANLTNVQFTRMGISFHQDGSVMNLTLVFSETCADLK